MDHVDEQVRKGVNQFTGAEMTECCQQGKANRQRMAAEFMNLLNRGPAAVALNYLRCQPAEQPHRQSKPTQPSQFIEFPFKSLDTDRPRIGTEFMQGNAATVRAVCKQGVQSLLDVKGKTIRQSTGKLIFESSDRRKYEPIYTIRCERFDTNFATSRG
jgi:hypothetical protein